MEGKYIVTVEKADENFVAKNEKTKADIKAEKKLTKENAKLEKKSESKRRKKERKEYRTNRLFLWVVVGAFLFVSASILFMNYKICFTSIGTGMPADKKAESTLLSSGLSIIGLASSVWIGLNIVQVLEKKELDALGKEVATYRRERCELNRRNFFNNLLALDDILNRHLYKLFSEIDDVSNDLATFYFECNKIELKFHNMYKKQNRIVRNLPISYYDDALRDIERLLRDIQNKDYVNEDLFVKYLKVRLAEVYFYKGYNIGANESRGSFNNAIKYFCEVFEELKKPKEIMEKGCYLGDDIKLTVYMFNTLGEAYSKILETCSKSDKGDYLDSIVGNVEWFYANTIKLIERPTNEKNSLEVYYRNYGCALERINKYRCNGVDNFEDKEILNKIRNLYHKAIDDVLYNDKEKLREQTFHVYISLYYKYTKSIGIMNYLDKNFEALTAIQKDITYLEEYTREVEFYINLAMTVTPLNMFFWKMMALVERDYTVLCVVKSDKEEAELHYARYRNWWERIKKTESRNGRAENGKKDPLYLELELAMGLLKNHIP